MLECRRAPRAHGRAASRSRRRRATSASASSQPARARADPEVAAGCEAAIRELLGHARAGPRSRCTTRSRRSAARDAPGGDRRRTSSGCGRASATTAPTSARGCSRACSCLRRHTSPACAGAAGRERSSSASFGRYDLLVAPAMPTIAAASRRRPADLPAGPDAVQLARGAPRAPGHRRPVRVRRRPARRARAHGPTRGGRRPARGRGRFQQATDWHLRRPVDHASATELYTTRQAQPERG